MSFETAAVIGTGMMGPGIALTLTLGGVRSTILGRTPESAAAGLERAHAQARVLLGNELVAAERIFLNCPRYLHRMELAEYSSYAPRAGHTPPVPDWKLRPEYREHLPGRDMTQLAAEGR